MVFLIMVGCCSFFPYLLGTLFGSAFLLELPARGIVFPFSSFGDAVGRYTRIENTEHLVPTVNSLYDRSVRWI